MPACPAQRERARATGATMSERLDRHEVMREVEALIDGFPDSEQRQILASLAQRYGCTFTEKSAPRRSVRYRPARARSHR